MCAVSAVSNWQHNEWGVPTPYPQFPQKSLDDFVKKLKEDEINITKDQWEEYQKLKAEEYDRKTNQPECQEDWKKLVDEKIEEYIKSKFKGETK